MHAHFRRTGRTKSLRSDKEFPNVFQMTDAPKNKDLTAIGVVGLVNSAAIGGIAFWLVASCQD
jgi:hypothetical protein